MNQSDLHFPALGASYTDYFRAVIGSFGSMIHAIVIWLAEVIDLVFKAVADWLIDWLFVRVQLQRGISKNSNQGDNEEGDIVSLDGNKQVCYLVIRLKIQVVAHC